MRLPTLQPVIRAFACRFLILFALGLALTVRFAGPLEAVSRFWARLLAATLDRTALGPAVSVGRAVAFRDGHTLSIVLECTGLYLLGMWCAFLLAFPAAPGHRWRGLALGAAVIAVLNMLRLVMAAWVLCRWPARFDLVHTVVWQTGMIVVLLGLAAVWTRGGGGGGGPAAVSAAAAERRRPGR